jgi:outer membrane protein OmpA-like peptidoglycan-associated protein
MADDDDNQNYALAVLAGVVALVIALVIGVAAWSTSEDSAAAPTATGSNTPSAMTAKVYFDLGSAVLPADANDVVNSIAETARANNGASVVISGFHDATGNAANNEELAKQRALAVRHALEADGVDPARLVLEKPAITTGGAEDREARRVEIRVQ